MNITVEGGKSKKMLTGGKYCPEDIVVTAESGNGGAGNENALVARTLTEYVNDTAVKIGVYAFYRYSGLTSVSCKAVTVLSSAAFQYCSDLVSVDFPKVHTGSANSFGNCTALTSVTLPSLATVTGRLFPGCTALTFADLANADTLASNMFLNCSAFTTLVLRRTTVCSLANVNVFDGTPYASGGTGGKVYVPSALVESYKTATNWSVLYGYGTCEFVALEGSEYE